MLVSQDGPGTSQNATTEMKNSIEARSPCQLDSGENGGGNSATVSDDA